MENNSGEGDNLVVPFSIPIDPLYAHAQRNGDTNLLTDILGRGTLRNFRPRRELSTQMLFARRRLLLYNRRPEPI